MGKNKETNRPKVEVNQDLMERNKAWDVALQRLADKWNAEVDKKS